MVRIFKGGGYKVQIPKPSHFPSLYFAFSISIISIPLLPLYRQSRPLVRTQSKPSNLLLLFIPISLTFTSIMAAAAMTFDFFYLLRFFDFRLTVVKIALRSSTDREAWVIYRSTTSRERKRNVKEGELTMASFFPRLKTHHHKPTDWTDFQTSLLPPSLLPESFAASTDSDLKNLK